MRVLAAAILVSLLVAGCAQQPGDVKPAATNGSVMVDAARPPPVAGNVVTGPAAGPDNNATLDAPPKLVPGEWWHIHMSSPLDKREADYVRVVAEDTGTAYVFGMPHEGWYKEAVIYHVPFFGDVEYDLSGKAHNIPFVPMKFPLKDDSSWKTKFEGGGDLTAHVKTDPVNKVAAISFTTANGATLIDLTYDAKIHEISSFKQNTIEYSVVEHGYGFEGWVTVPRAEQLVFIHGRIGAPVLGINPFPSPATPTETVDIAGGFNRLTFIAVAGGGKAFLGLPQDGGAFRETVTSPNGTKYMVEQTGPGMKIEFFENDKPDGKWSMEHVAAGVGVAFVEGIAYHQYDIRLPDGAKRSDHSHPVIR